MCALNGTRCKLLFGFILSNYEKQFFFCLTKEMYSNTFKVCFNFYNIDKDL